MQGFVNIFFPHLLIRFHLFQNFFLMCFSRRDGFYHKAEDSRGAWNMFLFFVLKYLWSHGSCKDRTQRACILSIHFPPVVTSHFITRMDLCNHYCSEDTELCHHYKLPPAPSTSLSPIHHP